MVAVGSSYPYYFLSTNHNLMPVSGDQGNIEVANYGPVAFKCDTFYLTFAVGCMFKRTKTGIQAITYGCLLLVERVVFLCAASNACSHRYTILYYTIRTPPRPPHRFTPMQPVTQHAICQVNECNGGNVCWGNINFDGYRVERGSSGEGAADGGCVSYTSSGFWPYFSSAFGAANWESPLPLGGERQLLLHSFRFVAVNRRVAHCGAWALWFGVSPSPHHRHCHDSPLPRRLLAKWKL